jgi:Zn-finger nucleic acid-binding protein
MICPACKNPMIVVEHNKIELDYCPECHGVWFDSGELELFLDSINLENREQFTSNLLNTPEAKTAEKKRRCPVCARRMKKIVAGDKPSILIDVCQKADGLWFDSGEVSQLIKQLPEKLSGKPLSYEQVSAFLGEVFKAAELTGADIK